MQELYNIIPKSQQGTENMILYAQAKRSQSQVELYPGSIAFDLPFHVEHIIRESNIQNSDEDKKQIFEHLVPIAEKSWSDTPNISNRYRQHSTDQSGTLAHILPYLLLPY